MNETRPSTRLNQLAADLEGAAVSVEDAAEICRSVAAELIPVERAYVDQVSRRYIEQLHSVDNAD